MFYFTYKITNTLNNRYYLGCHKTSDINDGYMGSGKVIRHAIEKYGLENFTKEILEYFDTSEEMYIGESLLITEETLSDPLIYNLKLGGSGSFDYVHKHRLNHTPESTKKRSESLKRTFSQMDLTGENNGFFGKKHSEKTKKLQSEIRKEWLLENEHPKGMLGKKHSEESRKRTSEKCKLNGSLIGKTGLDHPAGGTKWYNNGVKHLRSDIHPGEGWIEGRMFQKRNRKSKNVI